MFKMNHYVVVRERPVGSLEAEDILAVEVSADSKIGRIIQEELAGAECSERIVGNDWVKRVVDVVHITEECHLVESLKRIEELVCSGSQYQIVVGKAPSKTLGPTVNPIWLKYVIERAGVRRSNP